MRNFVVTLALCGLGLLVVGSAGAVPKPAPRFWSVARCERVLPEQHPAIRQIICVGTGEAGSCRWASDHHERLFSELRVFAWYQQANFQSLGMTGLEPGVIRSFTLATRSRPGFARIVHHWGDGYEGWPADFYMAHVRLVGTQVSAARFRDRVAPLAAMLAQHAKATTCITPRSMRRCKMPRPAAATSSPCQRSSTQRTTKVTSKYSSPQSTQRAQRRQAS